VADFHQLRAAKKYGNPQILIIATRQPELLFYQTCDVRHAGRDTCDSKNYGAVFFLKIRSIYFFFFLLFFFFDNYYNSQYKASMLFGDRVGNFLLSLAIGQLHVLDCRAFLLNNIHRRDKRIGITKNASVHLYRT
jgi:hypothetical protein